MTACAEKMQEKQTHFTLFDLALNIALFSSNIPLFVAITLAIAYKIDIPLFSIEAAITKITNIINKVKSNL